MSKAFWAELQKARRRHDLLLVLALPLLVLFWAGAAAPGGTQAQAVGCSALLYALPVLHTLVMPLGMAVLASRLWDAETKGHTGKLLFTLQSRQEYYLCKTALGCGYVLLLALAEAIGLPLLCRLRGYTEALDPLQLFWLALCTLTVDLVLYLAFSLLEAKSTSQMAMLGVGLGCSLCGLGAGFLPPVCTLFLPFAWYLPLDSMAMQWDAGAGAVQFTRQPLLWPLLVLAAVLAAALGAAGRAVIEKQEV